MSAKVNQRIQNSLWFSWETQRRNTELASAFDCTLFAFDYSHLPSPLRYFLSILRTTVMLITQRPKLVFAQAPSLILVWLLALLKPLFRYRLIIDAHNSALETAGTSPISAFAKLLQYAIRYALQRCDFIIVSNPRLVGKLATKSAKAIILPDKLPKLTPGNLFPPQADGLFSVLLVCTFAADEPVELFIRGAREVKDFRFRLFITGNTSKAGELLRYADDKIQFTGFLPHSKYDQLLSSVDLVVDLTTREDCLVCGGYEALSANKPLILSDHEINRITFPKGCLFSQNSIEGYSQALITFFSHQEQYKNEIKEMKQDFEIRWNASLEEAKTRLAELKN